MAPFPSSIQLHCFLMVIFVGGLPGTGKTTMASMLAKKLGIFHYDLDEVKKRIYATDPDFEKNIQEGLPFSDATRMKVFQEVAAQFPALAQEHEHILVEEVLLKRELRNILYTAAAKSFSSFVVIHITADESDVQKRLQNTRDGHMLLKPWTVYLELKKNFDGIPEADVTFQNKGDIQESAEKLIRAIMPFMKM